MLHPNDLPKWLRHNVNDLRVAPDMVTETAGPRVRFRWHGIAEIGGQHYGLGVDLHPGLVIGEIWMYGPGARDVRIDARGASVVPAEVRSRLWNILVAHVRSRESDWGRGDFLFDGTADAKACA